MKYENLIKEITSWYNTDQIPVHINEPVITQFDKDSVLKTLNDNWVSTAGPIVQEFEANISTIFENKKVVALNSGTSALHLALLGLGVLPGEQIITTPLTFVAPLNAVKYVGGVPLFIDISLKDLSIDIDKLYEYGEKYFYSKKNSTYDSNTGNLVRVLLVVDTFGHIGNIKKYRDFCKKYNIKLLVDSSESLGSTRDKYNSSKYSHVTTTSFNGNKIITSGSGGAVISNDDELIDKIRHLSTTANIGSKDYSYIHDQVGYNYRLPALNAALGNSQIGNLDEKIKLFRSIHNAYAGLVEDTNDIDIFKECMNSRSNYWLNLFIFNNNILSNDKYEFIKQLNSQGVGSRNVWNPLHQLPYVDKKQTQQYPNTEYIYNNGFNLASTVKLKDLT